MVKKERGSSVLTRGQLKRVPFDSRIAYFRTPVGLFLLEGLFHPLKTDEWPIRPGWKRSENKLVWAGYNRLFKNFGPYHIGSIHDVLFYLNSVSEYLKRSISASHINMIGLYVVCFQPFLSFSVDNNENAEPCITSSWTYFQNTTAENIGSTTQTEHFCTFGFCKTAFIDFKIAVKKLYPYAKMME